MHTDIHTNTAICLSEWGGGITVTLTFTVISSRLSSSHFSPLSLFFFYLHLDLLCYYCLHIDSFFFFIFFVFFRFSFLLSPLFLSSPPLILFITLSSFLSSFLPLSVSLSLVSCHVFSSPSSSLPAALSVNCVSPASGSDRRKCFYFEICLLQFQHRCDLSYPNKLLL